MRRILVKVRVPGVGHSARGIELDDLAMMVVVLPARGFMRPEAPSATNSRLKFPASHLECMVRTPLQGLLARDQRLEHAFGRAAISTSETTASRSRVMLVFA